MIKLDWNEPNVILQRNFSIASDTSPVNIYLLRKKYNIEVAQCNKILFRHYNGSNINRNGYGFPLSDKNFDLKEAIEILKADSAMRGESLRFCLCDEAQRAEIDKIIDVNWHSLDGDSDYIYKRESLARLSGRKLHAKKNHYNKFMKIYPNSKYLPIITGNLSYALNIAEKWISEHGSDDISLQNELLSIHETADNWEKLGMKGGILYADDEPAAMIMFSVLNEQCIDVHFEKSTYEFAQVGAVSTIRKFMASVEENFTYQYINLEEDLGIIGLKRAKESYRPSFKIKKYYGEVF